RPGPPHPPPLPPPPREGADRLPNFRATGVLARGPKRAPILWQLPPTFRFEADVLDAFLSRLPRGTEQAAEIARRHDHRVDPAYTSTDADRPMRHALEIRHESFVTPACTELLTRHNVALVVADAAGKYPLLEEVTADFVYIRLHGHDELYVSGYTDEGLDMWAEKIRSWAGSGDVYTYFDNDAKVKAPRDAMALRERLEPVVSPRPAG
ncbi:DUF72 domain-containing protein, partial [Nocardia abscessus]|uniref:DUF72 domain-containing protein n=1 Tax=Nocardia abscessus TaxID=120957 RepID=UPI0024564D80